MFLFYANADSNGSLILDGDEMRHAIKTLRKRVGDNILCTDGAGSKFNARIASITKREVGLEVLDQTKLQEPNPKLHIAIALTKNATRLEWFIEKATEIGVTQITPLITKRTEKKSFKHERGSKIVLSAMKQSVRYYLPQLDQAISIKDFLENDAKSEGAKFIAHYKSTNVQLAKSIKQGIDTQILIGPEGDFTPDELQLAEAAGYISINLGNHRLRTETAGIVACHTFNMLNHG